jgi:hypothetical protein
MHAYLNSIDYALWFSGLLLEFLILAAAIYRKQVSRHPRFVAYIIASIVKTLALIYVSAYASLVVYFYTYWGGMAFKAVLLLGVAYEVFADIFEPLDTIPKGKISRLLWMVTFSAFILIIAGVYLPARMTSPQELIAHTFDRTASLITISIFLLVLFQSEVLGISKMKNTFGICAGFMFFLSIDAALSMIRSTYPHSALPFHRNISMGAFIISGIIWLYYFSKPQPKVIPPTREQLDVLLKLATSWQVTAKKEIAL